MSRKIIFYFILFSPISLFAQNITGRVVEILLMPHDPASPNHHMGYPHLPLLEESFRWYGPGDPVPLAYIRQTGYTVHHPVGTCALSWILRTPRSVAMSDVMKREQTLIPADMDQEEVALRFQKYALISAAERDDT